jgi:type II secretory pathway component GspD/PulD (secretin)
VNRLACTLLVLFLAGTPAGAQSERFTVDARDVQLADVIRLLGARAGQNILADGSVKALRVTVRLTNVTFDEALAALAASYGLQTHREGRVVIVGDAASMSRRFADDTGDAGTRTQRFVLGHGRPDEVAAQLQLALPQGTVVLADKRTGAVLVSGSPATLSRARDIVAALDAPANGADGPAATETIQLHNLRASEAVKALKGTTPDNALFADDRQNLVVVSGNLELRTTVRTLLTDLDAPGRQVRSQGGGRPADQRQQQRRHRVRRERLRQRRVGRTALHADQEFDRRQRADRHAHPAWSGIDPRAAEDRDAQQPRSLVARRRAIPGRHGQSANRLSERADDRRRRAATPHPDHRR